MPQRACWSVGCAALRHGLSFSCVGGGSSWAACPLCVCVCVSVRPEHLKIHVFQGRKITRFAHWRAKTADFDPQKNLRVALLQSSPRTTLFRRTRASPRPNGGALRAELCVPFMPETGPKGGYPLVKTPADETRTRPGRDLRRFSLCPPLRI